MNGPPTEERRGGPYRVRNGVFFGVCGGIAQYLDVSVFWTRVVVVLAAAFTSFWPILVLYLVGAFVMKFEPVVPLRSDGDAEFYNSYTSSRTMALHRLKSTFDGLDRRIQRLEAIVTDKEFEWDRRLNGGH